METDTPMTNGEGTDRAVKRVEFAVEEWLDAYEENIRRGSDYVPPERVLGAMRAVLIDLYAMETRLQIATRSTYETRRY